MSTLVDGGGSARRDGDSRRFVRDCPNPSFTTITRSHGRQVFKHDGSNGAPSGPNSTFRTVISPTVPMVSRGHDFGSAPNGGFALLGHPRPRVRTSIPGNARAPNSTCPPPTKSLSQGLRRKIHVGFMVQSPNPSTKKSRKLVSFRDFMVGLTGFEPATP